jgi:hypothetical protein
MSLLERLGRVVLAVVAEEQVASAVFTMKERVRARIAFMPELSIFTTVEARWDSVCACMVESSSRKAESKNDPYTEQYKQEDGEYDAFPQVLGERERERARTRQNQSSSSRMITQTHLKLENLRTGHEHGAQQHQVEVVAVAGLPPSGHLGSKRGQGGVSLGHFRKR